MSSEPSVPPEGGPPVAPDYQQAKKSKIPWGKVVVVVAVIMWGIGRVFHAVTEDAQNKILAAVAGDCLTGNVSQADTVETAPCDAKATYQVLGKFPNVTQELMAKTDASNPCFTPFPATQAFFWLGAKDSLGTLFCVKDYGH